MFLENHGFPVISWWPVVIEDESEVCHNCLWGNEVLPKQANVEENWPWTISLDFAARMRPVPPTANGAWGI